MKERLQRLLGVESNEVGPVTLLLAISFLMGTFLATVTVASQTLFLQSSHFSEKDDLPFYLLVSGVFGIVATGVYNFLQGRIPYKVLAIGSLVVVILITGGIEFAEFYLHHFIQDAIQDESYIGVIGFTQLLPFTFICQLVFWGAFGRLFNLRQAKRVIGSVDVGVDIAQIIAFFSIPLLIQYANLPLDSLFTIGLVSIIGYLILFIILASRYLSKEKVLRSDVGDDHKLEKLGLFDLFRNRFLLAMCGFVVVSIVALRFLDYSFFNVVTTQFKGNDLASFLSLFEATIVIFGFLFTTFATDWIMQTYGLRVALLVNPILLMLFTGGAAILGSTFGYQTGDALVYFFIMMAMSKLFVNSLKGGLDDPVFKMYYIPMDKAHKLDAQTKVEGMVTSLASVVGGGAIVLMNKFSFFTLLSVTFVTLPALGLWYWFTNRMYAGYRDTLQSSLQKSRKIVEQHEQKEYTLDRVLEKEIQSTAEDKVIYGLKLMEKLEPALFENAVIQLVNSDLRRVKKFAEERAQAIGSGQEGPETRGLAELAKGGAEDSDLLSISSEKLMKLSKSVKQSDRMLAAKLLRKLISQKTIFILLELMRDPDARVRNEALLTCRRVKRSETWPVLIDLLSSPAYSYQAVSALKEAGKPALQVLEAAFHKSGQSDIVMLKIIQIIGHIGGPEGIALLWKKVDYPDKRIVKQILYSLRFIDYRAKGREASAVKDLLDTEMGKALWNLTAIDELPDEPQFGYLRQAIREEIRENYDQITLLLSLLYDPTSVQLVRENILAGTPDSIQYALELLDLFVDVDLKPKLVPLLDDSKVSDKLEKLQTYFPRESYNPVQVINYVLNRDFNYNNRWSKVCAIHAAAFVPNFRVSRGLISQMFNSDRLLQETAAWVIYNKDKAAYETITERLPSKDKRFLDTAIRNNQLLDGLDDGFFLHIEMILFMKELPVFKGIAGNLLSALADKITPLDVNVRDRVNFPDENPILIVAHGQVTLKNENEEIGVMKKGDVIGDLFQEGPPVKVTGLTATERSVVFKITLHDFYFVMANNHELAQGLIKNITGKALIQTD
ncbi:MAG: HEAT repeat domain-containing protein [Bacteroidota bacterium]